MGSRVLVVLDCTHAAPRAAVPDWFVADERRPNLSDTFIKDITERLGLEFKQDGAGDLSASVGPEDIFHMRVVVALRETRRLMGEIDGLIPVV